MTASPLRAILATNLKRLIAHAQAPSVRAWAITKGQDVKMIDRLTKGEHAVTLDKLYEIAEAAGVQPWHLLLEDFDPKAPADQPISAEDKAMIGKLRRLLGD